MRSEIDNRQGRMAGVDPPIIGDYVKNSKITIKNKCGFTMHIIQNYVPFPQSTIISKIYLQAVKLINLPFIVVMIMLMLPISSNESSPFFTW